MGRHDLTLRDELNIFSTKLDESTICINNHETTRSWTEASIPTATTTSPASMQTTEASSHNATQTHDLPTMSTPSSSALRHNVLGKIRDDSLLVDDSTALALTIAMLWLVMSF